VVSKWRGLDLVVEDLLGAMTRVKGLQQPTMMAGDGSLAVL
jgi:hypothetical protein